MTVSPRAVLPTVLVVDDEPSILDALQKVLTKENMHVRIAGSGQQALEVLRLHPVQVMITDLRMPGMTGEDLLKAAKAITPEVEVLVMTAYGTVENAVAAMKLGAYDFISKPLKRAAIVAAVQKALDKHALVAENRELRARNAHCRTTGRARFPGKAGDSRPAGRARCPGRRTGR